MRKKILSKEQNSSDVPFCSNKKFWNFIMNKETNFIIKINVTVGEGSVSPRTMEEGRKQLSYDNNAMYPIRPYKIIAQCLGIWCMNCQNFIPKMQLTIVCILLVTNGISLFHELNPSCEVPKDAILIPVSTAICCFLAVTKILSIRFNRKKMLQIITSILEDWSSPKNDADIEPLSRASKIGRKISSFQLLSAFISTIPMFLCGMGNSAIFDATKNETEIVKAIPLANPCFYKYIFMDLYIEIYLLQILQIIATILGNVGCDCYFFGVTMLLVGQIQCFASDIERFEPNRQSLTIVIGKHNHLIQMADHLEKIFRAVIAFQVMANVYQICMGGLQILFSIRLGDRTTAINFTIFVMIFLVQLSIYSYAGESLSSSINYLQTSLYSCPWYQVTPKVSKDLIFIMARCGKPFHLTAGKIISMNLESYKGIIKTLGSYFSVMQAMFDK
ncbi:odorant receptor 4-like [Diachasmimorpha longicaudata]|uniref:odorant receptor 4-like n=1 Tax=Diachasmimorpha longicaudata TaxID=58733 RepID=UPI0030B88ECD